MKRIHVMAGVMQKIGSSTVKRAVNSASFLYCYQEKEPDSIKEFVKKKR